MANYLIKFQSNKMAMWVNMPRKYILLDILVCSINDFFQWVVLYFDEPAEQDKLQNLKFFFRISDKVVTAWQIE